MWASTPVGVLCLVGLCWSLPVPFRLRREAPTSRSVLPENFTRPFAEDCQQYCSYTYPVHTYPEPLNFKACTAGCRSAQLDAFIAWPLQSDMGRCVLACDHMFGGEDQRYACCSGCRTPTIDTLFPNRSHLYLESNSTGSSDGGIEVMFPPVEDTLSYLFNSLFSFGQGVSFDDLTEHAESMELLFVPYLRSDVTILTNDGVYSYREYSFDNGDSILTDVNDIGDSEFSSYSYSTEPEDETFWLDQYRQQRNNPSCLWRLHRAALNKMLLVVSAGLIVAAVVTCFLSACSSETKRAARNKAVPTISAIKPSPPVSTKKAPYNLGSEVVAEKPPLLGSYRQVHQKITML